MIAAAICAMPAQLVPTRAVHASPWPLFAAVTAMLGGIARKDIFDSWLNKGAVLDIDQRCWALNPGRLKPIEASLSIDNGYMEAPPMEDIIAVRARTSARKAQDRTEKSREADSLAATRGIAVNVDQPRSARLRNACFDPQTRRAMIAEAAYLHAEKRGFAPGGELEDWLEAEAEFERLFEGEHFCGD